MPESVTTGFRGVRPAASLKRVLVRQPEWRCLNASAGYAPRPH